MPLRSDVDPRGLKGALEYCFIGTCRAGAGADAHWPGTHLGDLMGMEVRGMPISAFLDRKPRQQFGEALEEVFEPAVYKIDGPYRRNRIWPPELRARSRFIRCAAIWAISAAFLGGFTEGQIGRAPRFALN